MNKSPPPRHNSALEVNPSTGSSNSNTHTIHNKIMPSLRNKENVAPSATEVAAVVVDTSSDDGSGGAVKIGSSIVVEEKYAVQRQRQPHQQEIKRRRRGSRKSTTPATTAATSLRRSSSNSSNSSRRSSIVAVAPEYLDEVDSEEYDRVYPDQHQQKSKAMASGTGAPASASASAPPAKKRGRKKKNGVAAGAATTPASAAMAELEEHVEDLREEAWETESWYEDVIGSNTEDRFFTEIPGSCTPAEAMAYRRLLREVGPVQFMTRTVDAGLVTAKKLLTAFSVRPPEFLQGMPDEMYLPYLTTALTRELKKRPKLWKYNTVDDAVALIRQASNVVVLTGAGISTSLGIPDFRSKDTGLYSRLGDLGLSDPQEVFDIGVFRDDPSLFYSVARDIMLPEGDARCSPTHAFIALLQQRDKLLTNYTQNIDNLEAVAGIRREKLVQCHGSFSTASCILCGHRVDGKSIFPTIRAGGIPRCPKCAPKARTTANSRKRKAALAGDDDAYYHAGGSNSNSHCNSNGAAANNNDNSGSNSPAPTGTGSSSAASARPMRAAARRLNSGGPSSPFIDQPLLPLPHKYKSRSRQSSSDDSESYSADNRHLPSRGGILKPDITFFGEQLPAEFGDRLMNRDVFAADLVIVIGTSLKVAPVSEIVPLMPGGVPQIYIGRNAITHHNFDIDLLGDCDVVVAELCRRLGWELRHEMVREGERVSIELEEGHFSRHHFRALKEE